MHTVPPLLLAVLFVALAAACAPRDGAAGSGASRSSRVPASPTGDGGGEPAPDPGGGGAAPPQPPAATDEEFQINRETLREQERPSLAALPRRANNGAVAMCLFFDRSNTSAYTGEPKNQWSAAPVLPEGQAPGTKEAKIVKTSAWSVYCTIRADPGANKYGVCGRYEVINDSSAKTVWTSTVGAGGADFGGALVLDTEKIPSAQSLSTLDSAVDEADGARLCVWRLSGTSTSTGALPPALYGRIMGRPDLSTSPAPTSERRTAIFALSSAPTTAQRNPRAAFLGSRWLVVFEEGGVIKGRLFERAADPAGPDFGISLGTGAIEPQVAANASTGECAVVWQQADDVLGAIVRAGGTVGPTAVLNEAAAGVQEHPSPAVERESGAYLVVWAGPDGAGTRDIFARRFGPDLAPLGPEERVNAVTAGDQGRPAAAWVPLVARWLVAWTGADADLTGVKGRFLRP